MSEPPGEGITGGSERPNRGASIRPASPGDGEILARLVRELAVYEKLEHAMRACGEDFESALFGSEPCARALVAEVEGEPVGFALYFRTFSTFEGRAGLYLEDLYVRPQARGLGLGKALLKSIAREAVGKGYRRLEWAVLDWNEPAIGFYRSLGARPMADWTTFRVDGAALEALGGDEGDDREGMR